MIDFVHVLGYLWDAARCFYREGDPHVRAWVRTQGLRILQGHVDQVAATIRDRATRAGLSGRQREGADDAVRYLTNKREYLDYPTALQQGWPIATGVIEGACRHLVADRMDITGARWGLASAEAVLKLRALDSNGDLDEYWAFHLGQEKHRVHEVYYADEVIPSTQRSSP